MAVNVGGTNNIGAVNVGGTNNIGAIYVGTSLVWQKAASAALKSGLISCWELNDSGPTASDAYGGHIGTSYNSLTFGSSGKLGNCILLKNAGNPYLDFGFAPQYDVFTINTWYNFTSISNYGGGVNYARSCHDNFGYIGWQLNCVDRGGSVGIYFSVISSSITETAILQGYNPTLGSWYMVTAIKDTNTIYLYINGSLVAQKAAPATINKPATNMKIGSYAQYNMNAKVDQTAIWSRVLTVSEISQLYNSGNGLPFTSW